MKKLLKVIAITCSIIFLINAVSIAVEYIDVTEARYKLMRNDDLVLIDCRNKSSFEVKHISAAVSIPISELQEKTVNIPKDKLVIIYCESTDCNQSYIAAKILSESGFEKVKVLKGGIQGWES